MVAKQTASTPAPTKDGRAAKQAPAAARGSRSVAPSAGRNAPNIVSFFQESRAELRKVTWPTRDEAMNLTIAVIVMTVGIALFLGLIDAILNQLITPLIGG